MNNKSEDQKSLILFLFFILFMGAIMCCHRLLSNSRPPLSAQDGFFGLVSRNTRISDLVWPLIEKEFRSKRRFLF